MPKPTFHIPRSLLIVLLIMIAATLLVGMFRAFAPAHAEAAVTPAPAILQTQTPTATDLDSNDGSPAETPILPPGVTAGETTGIIAQAIVVVAIIILGAALGWRMSTPHLSRKSKK
jgi:hypothetical protein